MQNPEQFIGQLQSQIMELDFTKRKDVITLAEILNRIYHEGSKHETKTSN